MEENKYFITYIDIYGRLHNTIINAKYNSEAISLFFDKYSYDSVITFMIELKQGGK